MNSGTARLICGLVLVAIDIASFAASGVLGVLLLLAAIAILITSVRTTSRDQH